jgi:hypothetical protein
LVFKLVRPHVYYKDALQKKGAEQNHHRIKEKASSETEQKENDGKEDREPESLRLKPRMTW